MDIRVTLHVDNIGDVDTARYDGLNASAFLRLVDAVALRRVHRRSASSAPRDAG